MQDKQSLFVSRAFGLLLVAYLLFIALASFYLSDGVSTRRLAQAGFEELFFLQGELRLRWHNVRDISTNLLLYMPLGFLVVLYLKANDRLRAYKRHLFWGLLVSIGVEISQAFIGRFSDATDVLSNGTGYVVGFLIARTFVIRYGVQPEALLGLSSGQSGERINTLAGLRFAYVAIALLTSLLPLDISVSVTQIYSKLQAETGQMPRLIVDPLYHFRTEDPAIQYLTLKVLLVLPLGALSSVIQILRGRPSLLIPAFHCLVFSLLIESCNLFVQSNRSDSFIPVMAFLIGLGAAWTALLFSKRTTVRDYRSASTEWRYLLVSAGVLYGLLILMLAMSPYEFEIGLQTLRSKLLEETNLIPFRLHFSVRNIGAAVDIAREFLLYAPLGGLIALWLTSFKGTPGRWTVSVAAAALGGGFASTVEILQLAVVGRYPDITDVLLAVAGGVAGAWIAPFFSGHEEAAATTLDPGS